MDLTGLMETIGEAETSALGGLLIGIAFGAFAQKSRFCLRAAAVECGRVRACSAAEHQHRKQVT